MLTLVVFGAWVATMAYFWYAHRARQRSLGRLAALVDALIAVGIVLLTVVAAVLSNWV